MLNYVIWDAAIDCYIRSGAAALRLACLMSLSRMSKVEILNFILNLNTSQTWTWKSLKSEQRAWKINKLKAHLHSYFMFWQPWRPAPSLHSESLFVYFESQILPVTFGGREDVNAHVHAMSYLFLSWEVCVPVLSLVNLSSACMVIDWHFHKVIHYNASLNSELVFHLHAFWKMW